MNVGVKHVSERERERERETDRQTDRQRQREIHLLQSLINISYITTLQYVEKTQEVE